MNESLDQSEIDALLNNDSDSEETQEENIELTDLEKDAIGEMSNISMGSAATALYGLLDHKVEITAPKVKLSSVEELVDNYSRPCVVVDVRYVEGLQGNNQMILEQEDAAIITDLMMGGDGSDPSEDFGELQLSAVSEAMNQMMGAAATSMSDFFEGDKINISPPEAELIEVSGDAIKLEGVDAEAGRVVQVIFNMQIEDLIDSQIVQVMTVDFAKSLVDSLIKPVSDVASGLDEEEATPEKEEANSGQQSPQQSQGASQGSQQPQTHQPGAQVQQQPQNQPRQAAQPRRRVDSAAAASNKVRRDVEVQNVEFDDLAGPGQDKLISELDLIYDVDLELTVRLGKTKKSIKEILEMSPGSVIELDRLAGEAVDLLVNGKLIAKGEVVVIDENFGFRVTDIVSSAERINKL